MPLAGCITGRTWVGLHSHYTHDDDDDGEEEDVGDDGVDSTSRAGRTVPDRAAPQPAALHRARAAGSRDSSKPAEGWLPAGCCTADPKARPRLPQAPPHPHAQPRAAQRLRLPVKKAVS